MLALLVAGCGDSPAADAQPSQPQPVSPAPARPQAGKVDADRLAAAIERLEKKSAAASEAATGLEAGYFLGEWCLVGVSLAGMADRPGYEYEFAADGSLLYENKAGDDKRWGGHWKLVGDELTLVAGGMLSGVVVVQSLEPDGFVAHRKVGHAFRRGPCR